MIKIFYNNKFIILSAQISDEISATKINFLNKEEAKKALNNFLFINDSININIYNINPKETDGFLAENFVFIQAAGGIVSDSKNNVLFIKRLGFVDLPKGKVEKGEDIQEAAVREVCEECGMLENDLWDVKLFDKTYHIYPFKESYAFKETVWFNMSYHGDNKLTPQTEEDITELFWVKKNKISNLYSETYLSLVDLLEKV